jgi:hypothetical protein
MDNNDQQKPDRAFDPTFRKSSLPFLLDFLPSSKASDTHGLA